MCRRLLIRSRHAPPNILQCPQDQYQLRRGSSYYIKEFLARFPQFKICLTCLRSVVMATPQNLTLCHLKNLTVCLIDPSSSCTHSFVVFNIHQCHFTELTCIYAIAASHQLGGNLTRAEIAAISAN